jgi:hypothetical protein
MVKFFKRLWRLGVDDPPKDEKKFSQVELDHIVQERLARDREKFKDYDVLVKFREEHQKQIDAQSQKELEAKKEYETLKGGYETKIKELGGTLQSKEQEIRGLRVNHTLTTEISKQNGYVDEALALLSGVTVVDQNGTVIIKARDANGIESNLSVEEGVKKFLEQRPHLVKATKTNGGNTPPAGGGGGGANNAEDLSQLTADLQAAQARGDRKAVGELTAKINANFAKRGVRRMM